MKARHDQHFLINKKAIEKIAGFECVKGRRVLEIGPGEGPLTNALLEKGADVIAVELDSKLVSHLKKRFLSEINGSKLTLIHGDAIQCDIPPFDIVVANLPYSASSKITFRLMDIGFEVAVLMYQKEFAQRMIARPGTTGCGRLSVMVQTYAYVKPMLELSPKSFNPPPEVYSWVLKITPHEPKFQINDRKYYALVVRELFSHRRKTIGKTLKLSKGALGVDSVEKMLSTLSETILKARAEALSLEEFAEISNMGSAVKNRLPNSVA